MTVFYNTGRKPYPPNEEVVNFIKTYNKGVSEEKLNKIATKIAESFINQVGDKFIIERVLCDHLKYENVYMIRGHFEMTFAKDNYFWIYFNSKGAFQYISVTHRQDLLHFDEMWSFKHTMEQLDIAYAIHFDKLQLR